VCSPCAPPWTARPLRATGAIGHPVNAVIVIALVSLPATAGAAMLFYGTSMLLATARRSGGCEVTAIPNALLGPRRPGCAVLARSTRPEGALTRSSQRRGARRRSHISA
jgi:hypothetical protein